MADFIPVTADEWPTTDELWRMLHTALRSRAFTARKQLLFCAGARRASARVPVEYRPIIDELEAFAERPDLPTLDHGKQFADHSFGWNRASAPTALAKRHVEIAGACSAIMDRHITVRIPRGEVYYEGYPGFEQDEAMFYAVMGHVFGALELDEHGNKSSYQADLLRDVLGNPLRSVGFDSAWRTDTAVSLARTMYEAREFGAMPILADALQDAGCDSDDILDHCRKPGMHFRGCWACDLVLGKS